MWCILSDDKSFVVSSFGAAQPDNQPVVEIADDDARAVTFNLGQTAKQLISYVDMKRDSLAAGGFSFNVAAQGDTPVVIAADTDASGLTDLAGLVTMVGQNPNFTTVWDQSPNGVTLNAKQIVALGVAVGTFRSAIFATAASTKGAVVAGTIHTRADVDAAAWPANHG